MKKTLGLIILDGFGHRKETDGNAIAAARTPNLDRLFRKCPHTLIGASGADVGLPDGQMGNSEVGHTNIGAGRIVHQELTLISRSIDSGEFFRNPALVRAMDNAKRKGHSLHLLGLLSDGGVHSHTRHLTALLNMAKRNGVPTVNVHCFTDGRDVPPTSGIGYVRRLQDEMSDLGIGRIATISGRFYAMDRDGRWERVARAYDALVKGRGMAGRDPVQVMRTSYERGTTDEFIVPTVVTPDAVIRPGDSVILFNFRPDRAREITRALVDPGFTGFERDQELLPLTCVCMTPYDATMPNVETAFRPETLTNTFAEYVSRQGLTQLRIAETEKYAHVTFFFNGGREEPYPGEDRVLIPSPKVTTYDLQPEMSACSVTDEAVRRIESGKYDVVILNYANCDMVGHTGIFEAAVRAVEAVDASVGRLEAALRRTGGRAFLTADHGNAEQMREPDGRPFTAHTSNPVPFMAVGFPDGLLLREGGRLADIAPTMLDALGLKQPEEMTGVSLLRR